MQANFEISAKSYDKINVTNVTDGLTVYSFDPWDLSLLKPFLLAARTENYSEMRTILSSNPTLLAIRGGYSSLLIVCVENNLVAGVIGLTEDPHIVKQLGDDISYALRYAKTPEVADLLLSHGAQLEYGTGKWQIATALMYACFNTTSTMVQFYLDRGVDVEAKTCRDETPLMIAARYGTPETLALLLSHKASLKARDKGGATPLIHAIDKVANMRVLIQHGADTNANSCFDNTALSLAVSRGAYEATRLLLSSGAKMTKHLSEILDEAPEKLNKEWIEPKFLQTAQLAIAHFNHSKSAKVSPFSIFPTADPTQQQHQPPQQNQRQSDEAKASGCGCLLM
ncbi:MAG: ankyrin repeat domain-containing protein [Legionellales bacterium]